LEFYQRNKAQRKKPMSQQRFAKLFKVYPACPALASVWVYDALKKNSCAQSLLTLLHAKSSKVKTADPKWHQPSIGKIRSGQAVCEQAAPY